ncbi:MAG: DUF1684 domain-containing protein [Pseudomonadota bacterium]
MRVYEAPMWCLCLLSATVLVSEVKAEPEFLRLEGEWRAKRLERLTSQDGWLTLVGLYWLHDGANPVGSGKENSVLLPVRKGPERLGVVYVENGKVRIRPEPGTQTTVNGEPIKERELATDENERPDVIRVGNLSLTVLKREQRYAIRARDPNSPVRKGFKGLDYFLAKEEYRMDALFTPYEKPLERKIPSIVGIDQIMTAPGIVKFKLKAKELTLEPVLETPDAKELFFIFKDETSGHETYPAGRFLYSELPKDGKVVVDFNHAYNPPCAFTPYATCPLPPERNRLPVRIEAGEKRYKGPAH